MNAPLSIGIPVPEYDASKWNVPFVKYDGGGNPAHAVELYGVDDKGQYLIFDQYEPHLKTLSADYYLPLVSQGIITSISKPVPVNPNPVTQNTTWNKFWQMVFAWGNGFKYNVVSIIN